MRSPQKRPFPARQNGRIRAKRARLSRSAIRAGHGDSNALRELAQHFAELREYAGHYCQARGDSLHLAARSAKEQIEVRIIIWLLAAAALVTAVVFGLQGIAGGLTILCGGQDWLGSLLAGTGGMASLVVVLYIRRWIGHRVMHRRLVEAYERRKRQQRTRFDHGVPEELP